VYINPIVQRVSISFGAGKSVLYSDFDDTFMPGEFNHSVLGTQEVPFNKKLFKKIFDPFCDFIQGMQQKFEFILTSGRNYNEIKYNMDHIPDDVNCPLPKFFIACNGSDILEHTGQGFNYIYSQVSKNKEDQIKSLSGWEIDKAKETITGILKNNDLNIIESKINSSAREYPGSSIEDGLEKMGKTGLSWFASIRQNDRLHMNIAFSKDVPERTILAVEKEINEKLSSIGINSKVKADLEGLYSGGYRTINVTPKINNEPLSKLFDTRNALKRAIKENDLIIVAGDSSNDREMLNIFRYLDTSKYEDFPVKSWSHSQNKLKDQLQQAFEYLKTNAELRREIDKLPIVSIIVNNGRDNDALAAFKELFPALNHDGIVKFIYVTPYVNNGIDTLPKAVKYAVKSYAAQNAEFAKNLAASISPELKKELQLPKISKSNRLIAASAVIVAAVTGIYAAVKSIMKNKSSVAQQPSTLQQSTTPFLQLNNSKNKIPPVFQPFVSAQQL